jgi:hypothetical protein
MVLHKKSILMMDIVLLLTSIFFINKGLALLLDPRCTHEA